MSSDRSDDVSCPSEDLLHQYLRGMLSPEDQEATTTHVETCDRCVAVMDGLISENSGLIDLLKSSVEPPPHTESRAGLDLQFTPGQRLGEYRILELLGKGSMGEVYRVLQRSKRRMVALKILRGPQSNDAVLRFHRSNRIAEGLQHPNIVQSLKVSEENGIHYLVMELIDGCDVEELLGLLGCLSVSNACEVVRQAAEGLAYGHGRGCVHRDIKPSNLLIDGGGVVKITDYGLALLRPSVLDAGASTTAEGLFLGTPDYSAPEQFDNASEVDGRADVYALGCTLYRLLSGRVPFDLGTHRSLSTKIRDHQQTTPPTLKAIGVDVPPDLETLVQEMLAKNVEQRCQAGEVANRLKPLSEGAALKELVERCRGVQVVPETPRAADLTAAAASPKRGQTTKNYWPWLINGFVVPGLVSTAAFFLYRYAVTTDDDFELILDDTDIVEWNQVEGRPGWRISSLPAGYNGRHWYNEDGSKTARWEISELPVGTYTVYATWPEEAAKSSSGHVIYHLHDGENPNAITRAIDQQKAPTLPDGHNTKWALIATIPLTSGRLVVELDAVNSRGPGVCRVDAIRLVRSDLSTSSVQDEAH
ncbi:MAG: protein kinase domain-containing protein [Planctomycetaceae bacterium]